MDRADPALTRHVLPLWPDLDALLVAADAVRDLQVHPGWTAVRQLIDAEVSAIDGSLDTGREPLTQAQYALQHGRRGGLLAIDRMCGAVTTTAEREFQRQRQKHELTGAESPREE